MNPADPSGRVKGGRKSKRLVRVRRRKRPSPLQRATLRPLAEILQSLPGLLPRGSAHHPLLWLGLGAGSFWLAWPGLAPGTLAVIDQRGGSTRAPMEVVSVFVEDPQRTVVALGIWKRKPGSLLVLQGRPSSQLDNLNYLRHQGQWPKDERGLIRLEPGCDTVGQLDALATYLSTLQRRGTVTIVTSPAHLPRSIAIARIVLGPLGWQVQGQAAVTGDNRPESWVQLWRDQGRAQLLRLTGLTGSRPDNTCN